MTRTWRERIVLAREHGRFVGEDRSRAAQWSTCAVGELARLRGPQIVQLENGRPVDAVFSELGTSFFAAVLANDMARAEATLAEIEDQARITSRAAAARPKRGRRLAFAGLGVSASATASAEVTEAAQGNLKLG
jgi:hypothetical protein